MKIFDTRWRGAHGIGRFASELYGRFDDFSPIRLEGRPSSPFDPLVLARYLYSSNPELFFTPGYNVPVAAPCPFVFCIHDLNHLHVADNSSALKRAYYELVVRRGIRRANGVLTVSEYSRSAICEWAGIGEERVTNVGNGVSDAFTPDGPSYQRVQRPYFLYVGHHRPHKNFARVVEAFAASRLGHEFALVSTGMPTDALQRLIAGAHLTDAVVFVGQASDADLAALYRGAVALAFVSLYEGFGLPIAEAMACGTPVLTSTATSMPEVAGDAALLVDPTDVDAIRAALVRLSSDATLRRDLRMRGLERAKLFTWDATARKVANTLLRVSGRAVEVT